MRYQTVITLLATTFLMSVTLNGCTVFLPGKLNSNERKDEKVNLTLIKASNCEGLESTEKDPENNEKEIFTKNYLEAFPKYKEDEKHCPKVDWNFIITQKNDCRISDNVQTEAVAPLVTMAASAAIGFATDFIKGKMEEEKALYTAQYSVRQLKDDFWEYKESDWIQQETENGDPVKCKSGDKNGTLYSKTTTLTANYLGFKVERKINSHVKQEKKDKKGEQASVFFYGFAPSADRRFLQIRPLFFDMKYAKAKVLSNDLWTWFWPPSLITKLFKIPAGTVDVEIGVDMESYAVGKDGAFTGPKTIAAFKTMIPGYKLDDKDTLVSIIDNTLQSDPGWLLAPPISIDERIVNKQSAAGNIKLIVNVTERDTSEAPKMIKTAEDWVSKGGDEFKIFVEKKLEEK
jgi:hypothetical protein